MRTEFIDINQISQDLFSIDSDENLMMFCKEFLFSRNNGKSRNVSRIENRIIQGMMLEEFISQFTSYKESIIYECVFKPYRRRHIKKTLKKDLVRFKIEVESNKRVGLVTYSEQYIDELLDFVDSIINQADFNFRYESELSKKHFTMNSLKVYDFKGLRRDLVTNKLICPKTKTITLWNIFLQRHKKRVKINWIGGKGKLACFLKILKEEQAILDKYIYRISSEIFLINGHDHENLVHPKKKDFIIYKPLLEEIARRNIVPRKENDKTSIKSLNM